MAQGRADGRAPLVSVDTARMLAAGGFAGTIARTCTAPLDRVKLLFQVQGVMQQQQMAAAVAGSAGAAAAAASSAAPKAAYRGIGQALLKIYQEEGILAYWKGNLTNVVRIFPYSAAQLMANDTYKRFANEYVGELTVYSRLACGAMAGMTATALTHPLDTLRLRLALPNSGYAGVSDAVYKIATQEGILALYRGLLPTLIGIAPYAALNFASYDMLKGFVYRELAWKEGAVTNLGIGSATGMFAATVCYPLDTVRRRMQMKDSGYKSIADALLRIGREEGVKGYYRGWAANCLKVVPQNSIRFVSYELIKQLMGVKKKKTDT